jgi:hypothetical protein
VEGAGMAGSRPAPSSPTVANTGSRGWFGGGGRDLFVRAMESSKGVVAARFSDYGVRFPDGRTMMVRMAWPMEIRQKMNVIVVSPSGTTPPGRYDLLAGALAGQGYLVVTLHHSQALTNRESALLRAGEARFAMDNVPVMREILGGDAKRVDANVCGVLGHGDGAWTALGLAGWASDLSASDAFRDGRIRAGFALTPSRPLPRFPFPRASQPGARGLVAGRLETLPLPPPGSGLLGLGLPLSNDGFSGMIGPPSGRITGPSQRRPDELAAATAGAILFFDWMLKDENNARDQLLALEGRTIPGLDGALRIRRA